MSGRAESSSNSNLRNWNVDLKAVGDTTMVELQGSCDTDIQDVALRSIKVTQKIDGYGGLWTIVPRYNFPFRRTDVRVAYGTEDTVIAVDASDSMDAKLTVSQRLGYDHSFTPSITSQGDLELEYRRDTSDGSVTATYKPYDSANVKWEEGPWQANFKAPLEGLFRPTQGVQMNIRRSVDFY